MIPIFSIIATIILILILIFLIKHQINKDTERSCYEFPRIGDD